MTAYPSFPHLHSQGLGRIPPALTSGRARLGGSRLPDRHPPPPTPVTPSFSGSGMGNSRTTAGLEKHSLKPPGVLLAPRCPRPSALTSPLWRLRVMRTVCLAGLWGGAGQSMCSSCSQASERPRRVPPLAHISPAPGPWSSSRPS